MPTHTKRLLETVFPSDVQSIAVWNTNDQYGGAHVYSLQGNVGFHDGETHYEKIYFPIAFCHNKEDGTVIPGILNEQLIIVLKDRITKLNAVYPHPENENMLIALDEFLAASKRRIEERMNRGVMGELKK